METNCGTGDHDYADASNLQDCDNKRTVIVCTECGDRYVQRWTL